MEGYNTQLSNQMSRMCLRRRVPDMAGTDVVILCADHATRGAVRDLVENCGVSSAVARGGYHASRLLHCRTVRLLITDRLLPPWPGLASWSDLKLEFRGLGVVVIVEPTIQARNLSWWMGADAVLSRPPSGRGWERLSWILHPDVPMEGRRTCTM